MGDIAFKDALLELLSLSYRSFLPVIYHIYLIIFFTGYYCTSGVDRPDPSAGNDTLSDPSCPCPSQSTFTGVGGLCTLGHYCPQASDVPTPCAAGSYADEEGMVLCKTCPAGFYCLSTATNFTESLCPMGEYADIWDYMAIL